MTRVILETKFEDHDPHLYRADVIGAGVDGFIAVTDTAVAQFREQGYLLVRGLFTADEVKAALTELNMMVRADDPQCEGIWFEGSIREAIAQLPQGKEHGVSGHIENLALGQTGDTMPALAGDVRAKYVRKFNQFAEHHPPLRVMLEKPELVQVVEKLIGERAAVLQEMAMIKPPGGREKPWHQDHAYFNYPLETRIVGTWISLGDATPENGCMHVLAGAHRDGPQVHWRRRDWQICDAEAARRTQTAIPAQAGDVLFFDSKLPHGTPINRSDAYRWALQYHFIPASAVETPDEDRLAIFGSEGKDVTC
ncbi:MAG: phytanoyl-CoA dioxygenase family protein [Candidatus Hydrogenedentes bacterium]|nr:phytanoyl-CoA dioxygenase family protein [Candidatus Hydrogenedentota bacterium]